MSYCTDDGRPIYLHGSADNDHKLLFAKKKDEWHFYNLDSIEEISEKSDRANRKITKAVTQKKLEEKLEEKKDKDTRTEVFVFYDLETIFNEAYQNLAQAYSAVSFACTRKEFENLEMNPENLQAYLSRCQVFSGDNCVGEMVEKMMLDFPADQYKKTLISFNGSCFDDYFVL